MLFAARCTLGFARRSVKRTRGARHALKTDDCPQQYAWNASAARAARDLARLHQLEPRVVRPLQERDARSVGYLRRPFEEPGAETGEPRDVGLDVGGVEAEVLEAVVRQRVAGPELLVGPRTRDVDVDAAVRAPAAHEAIAEHAGLVAGDLEVERVDVPLGGLAGILRLQVDVVDAVAHGSLLVGCDSERKCTRCRAFRRLTPKFSRDTCAPFLERASLWTRPDSVPTPSLKGVRHESAVPSPRPRRHPPDPASRARIGCRG